MDVPIELRRAEAEKAAVKWGLTGVEYLELMLAAVEPRPHRPLTVDRAKADLVRRGRRVPGAIPELPPQDPWVRR